MILTVEQLREVMPNCRNPEEWCEHLHYVMEIFKINSNQRVAAFLANAAHESSELNVMVENLNYSDERLMEVWPSHFKNLDIAQQYARNPEKLANKVYANRLGNGNKESGEGWKYRGRGIFQITGKYNYHTAHSALGFDLLNKPENAENPRVASMIAGWFWETHKLNEYADKSQSDMDDDFISICKRINGGLHGLKSRRGYYRRVSTILQC